MKMKGKSMVDVGAAEINFPDSKAKPEGSVIRGSQREAVEVADIEGSGYTGWINPDGKIPSVVNAGDANPKFKGPNERSKKRTGNAV